jgi:hypothetical protein
LSAAAASASGPHNRNAQNNNKTNIAGPRRKSYNTRKKEHNPLGHTHTKIQQQQQQQQQQQEKKKDKLIII